MIDLLSRRDVCTYFGRVMRRRGIKPGILGVLEIKFSEATNKKVHRACSDMDEKAFLFNVRKEYLAFWFGRPAGIDFLDLLFPF